MPAEILDVAVIGGGVSGAYTAWRLKEAQPHLNVQLFEFSNRIGGRLYTRTLPGMPHVHAELGGMRYIPKTQALVANLIGFLGLPSVEFLMGNPNPAPGDPTQTPLGASNNLYYLRRKHIRLRDLAKPGEIPYAVSWNERGLDPDHLQTMVMNYLVPNNAELTPDDWFKVKVFGRELFKFGFWDLLFRVLTNEAYDFMKAAGGYDANVANANAVSQLPPGEFGPGVHFRTLRDGYQRLPEALVERFAAATPPGSVQMNHRLASITKTRSGIYLLHFKFTEPVHETNRSNAVMCRINDQGPRHATDIRAHQVVLAMPRRSLELIEWEGWDHDDVFRMRKSVLMQAAFKLFLGYEQPWWRGLGLYAGRSITDLPIRQVYYFGSEHDHPGAEQGNFGSLLMASYNDIGTVPFWKATENDEPFKGYPTHFTHGHDPMLVGEQPVTQGMVELAQNQLRELHNQVSIPAPYSAIYHDWTDDPFGAGWHEWKAGVTYNDIMPKIRKPVPTEEVYICGEAYSNNQGWVEGALQTAEKMLQVHFGAKRPSWLPPTYDLSW